MTFDVLGICGSLRAGSYNRSVLRAAGELAPASIRITGFEELREIPPYDADVEAAGLPPPVQRLKEAIARSDALLFVSPEYNYGVPGVLKNAIDWASRPAGKSPMVDKAAAIMSASRGIFGGARMQYQLRHVLHATRTHVLAAPEIMIARVHERVDADGRLHDDATREMIGKQLAALADWIERLRRHGG